MTTKTSTKISEPIVDAKGTELAVGYRVTTVEGHKAAVTRIDTKSRRAVVVFEDPELKATMRAAHRLTVIKNKGKISLAKTAVKSGAKAKADA